MSSSDTVPFQRDLPVRHEVEVCVAGGGPAGVAAALAAAQQGASVFLAEGHTCFGGMGTAGLVPAFMTFGDGENFLAGGMGRLIYDALWERGGFGPDADPERSQRGSVCIRAETLKRVYDDLLLDAGVQFGLQTHVVAVETDGPRVTHVVCWGKSGPFAIRAQAYVDATGDGDVAAWAGAPFEKGDAEGLMMPGTLCSLWSDVDWDAVRAAKQHAQDVVPKGIEDGVLSVPDYHLPGMWRVGRHVGGGNIGHTFGVDATDERSLTEALLAGRRMLEEYETFYKRYLTGHEDMELVATGSLLGIRETRRIMGDYVLCLDDFERRAVFPDEIGRYCYPVDVHASRPSAQNFEKMWTEFKTLRYGKGESYGIPYRSLVPKGLDNVWVSGRCISSDRFLQGSVRVMPGCFITGQAAGVAAAMAAQDETVARDLDVKDLQRHLKALGAHLPNAED